MLDLAGIASGNTSDRSIEIKQHPPGVHAGVGADSVRGVFEVPAGACAHEVVQPSRDPIYPFEGCEKGDE